MSVATQTHAWWGQRLSVLLDDLGAGAARRVQRGQALARRGGVEDLRFAPGAITATVAEDRAPLAEVSIGWPVAGDDVWARAEEVIGARLRFVAGLLDGRLPTALAEELEAVGLPLLPSVGDLVPRCSCGAVEPFCRHVVAVHTVAASQVDRDVTLLLALRGRTAERLLEAVRPVSAAAGEGQEPAAVAMALTEAAGDLEAVTLHPAPPDEPAALLHQLGAPPGIADDEPLVALIAQAAATAWRLAAGDGAEAADRELLLTELRAQGVASAASLAAGLGRDADDVRSTLDELFEAGAVLRTGSGERTRYRAASS